MFSVISVKRKEMEEYMLVASLRRVVCCFFLRMLLRICRPFDGGVESQNSIRDAQRFAGDSKESGKVPADTEKTREQTNT